MNEKNPATLYFSWLAMVLGTAIYAFGLYYFIIPNELMEGGATGIALLLHYAIGLSPAWGVLLINVPLFSAGLWLLGKQDMVRTLSGTLLLSLFLALMEWTNQKGWIVPFYSDDYFLVTLYAGVVTGTGLGLVFRYRGTTGGTDILARIGFKLKGWGMGRTMLVMDAVIIGSAVFYVDQTKILYTLVVVFIASRMIHLLQEGAYVARAFHIISMHAEEIARQINNELERGVTLMSVKGAWSGQHKTMIYCVIYRQQTRQLKRLVQQIDPAAFVIVSQVQNVHGEGFPYGPGSF